MEKFSKLKQYFDKNCIEYAKGWYCRTYIMQGKDIPANKFVAAVIAKLKDGDEPAKVSSLNNIDIDEERLDLLLDLIYA